MPSGTVGGGLPSVGGGSGTTTPLPAGGSAASAAGRLAARACHRHQASRARCRCQAFQPAIGCVGRPSHALNAERRRLAADECPCGIQPAIGSVGCGRSVPAPGALHLSGRPVLDR